MTLTLLSLLMTCQKTNICHVLGALFYIRIPNLIFNVDIALEGSIQNLTQQKLFGNLVLKSVKLYFSV